MLFDTWERMTALGGYLRRELLPSLPARNGRGDRRPLRRPTPPGSKAAGSALAVELELRAAVRGRVARAAARPTGIEEAKAPRRSSPGPAASRSPSRSRPTPPGRPGLGARARPRTARDRQGAHPPARRVRAERRQRRRARRRVDRRITTVDLLREVLPRTDAQEAYRWLSAPHASPSRWARA